MKFFSLLTFLLALAGCTTTAQVQQQCAQVTADFPTEISCMENVMAQDAYLSGDSFAQEYILGAKVLADKVRGGAMSENEARYRLAQSYNRMLVEQQRLNAYDAMEWEALRPRDTNCTVDGDQVRCKSY